MDTEPPTTLKPQRRLSTVLAKVTLLLALALGVLAGVSQMLADLKQEKRAVEYSAEQFLSSVAPSAASAAYNYYLPAAEQVAAGLFTQRAISAVTIMNEGTEMISRTREVAPTLPAIGQLTQPDLVTLSVPLLSPAESDRSDVIGEISITVDRSVVAPSFVNRMVWYFLFATIKNFILGILLILILYAALARHIVSLADVAGKWRPSAGPLKLDDPPKMLRGTELDVLGEKIKQLAETARQQISVVEASRKETEQNNSELNARSQDLSRAVEKQNEELQRANRQLRDLAEHDALTGLLNRGAFDRLASDAFVEAVETDSQLSILLLDVDHFKAYNDHYGHQAGDDCLIRIARIIEKTVAQSGGAVARFGGEEFVCLIQGLTLQGAMEVAEEIHARLAQALLEHQRSTIANHITISLGVASLDTIPDPSLDALISAADEALYEAKRNGRNRSVASTDAIRETIRQTRQSAQTLLRAVKARAFQPFFQPQVDARTGAIIGAEALVRWTRDDGSIATPQAFLDTAQENRLLPAIDHIVLDGVISFLDRLAAQGLSVPRVSVNAPRDTLLDSAYLDKVIWLANTRQTQIAIELLETAILDSPEPQMLENISKLRDSGVAVEIDDFGTGHTSILSLMTLKPSRLKIARELVMPMADQTSHQTIVASVIRIGEALGIDVMAEGIETAEISQVLVSLGCPLQQGYHFARPMPMDDMIDLLAAPSEDWKAAGSSAS